MLGQQKPTGLLTQNIPSSITNALASAPKLKLSTQLTPASTPTPAPVTQPQTSTNLDPDAVNLSKAIRQVETGNQVKPGATGELPSRYQFMPDTWKGYAKEVLGDENAPMTLENENQVAYTKIKKWKDEGYNVGQIASMWNAGGGRPNAYVENWKKVDPETGKVLFDTPAYAEKVANEYHRLKAESASQYNAKPFSGGIIPSTPSITPTPEDKESLGSQLGQRGQDISTAFTEAQQGKINPISGALQIAGGVAGGLGDIINKGIEQIPGVKAIEGVIGKGAQSFFGTEIGKSVATSLNDFQTEHPELSKDLGAGFNIVTAIPILKGLSQVGGIAANAASKALANTAKNIIAKDLTSVELRTMAGKKALNAVKGDLDILIENKAIPTLVNEGGITRYSTDQAEKTIFDKMGTLEDDLKGKLAASYQGGASTQVPIEQLRRDSLATVKEEFKSTGNVSKAVKEVNNTFDDYKSSYGDYVSLSDLHDMKIGISKSVNFASPKVEQDVTAHIRRDLMKAVESNASKAGIPDVKVINQELQKLYRAQDLLSAIKDKRVINKGLGHNLIKGASTAVGAGIGSMFGGLGSIPGAAIGFSASGSAEKALQGLTQRALSRGILSRSSKPIVSGTAKSKIGGLLGASLAQKANQNIMQK